MLEIAPAMEIHTMIDLAHVDPEVVGDRRPALVRTHRALARLRLACDERLRHELGNNLRRYLDTVVSWDVVTGQYDEAYALAREAVRSGKAIELPPEF